MSSDNLERFRAEWISQLNTDIQASNVNRPSTSTEFTETYTGHKHNRPVEKESLCVESRIKRKCLQGGRRVDKQKGSSSSKDEKIYGSTNEENLIDILIADIDELVSLPFFDLELPKEIAINIFSFLSIGDLMNCAYVNSKWKLLADDDMIWYNMCRKYGYVDKKVCALDRENWKHIFQLEFQNESKFKLNWKQRICQISELEYEKGGILYAASIFDGKVIAGYANGLVKLWDICQDSATASLGCLLAESGVEDNTDSAISCVAMNNVICAAAYNNGAVRVWQNGLDFSLVDSFTMDSQVDCIHASEGLPSVISASGKAFRIDASDENGQWKTISQSKKEQNIKSVHLVGGSDYCSVVHTLNHVDIHSKDGLSYELEQTISAEVSSIYCHNGIVAVGITPLDFSILEGYRVKTYSVCNGQMSHLMKGPHAKVLCLCGSSNENSLLAVGSSDKRVRIHDSRLESPVMSLRGLSAPPCSLQVDEWKVVSGDTKGFVSVWDQRNQALLWQTNMRHPVRICTLSGACLVSVCIPIDKNPKETFWYADDLIQHRRHRGSIRIFDFSVENNTAGIPDICQSNYDNYEGYNYNINLVTPYDDIL